MLENLSIRSALPLLAKLAILSEPAEIGARQHEFTDPGVAVSAEIRRSVARDSQSVLSDDDEILAQCVASCAGGSEHGILCANECLRVW